MMKRIIGPRFIGASLVLLLCIPGRAQKSAMTESLPELDVHVGLNLNVRLVFQDKRMLDDSGLIGTELGPSIEFYLKPIRLLREVTLFNLDETKSVPLTMSIGYRKLIYPGKPTTSRVDPVVEAHLPLWGHILVSDRNRADIDRTDGSLDWRYRNRLTMERRFTIRSYHPGPYASVEFLHTSRYAKWSNTRVYAGCLLPLGRHLDLDPYYEHDNNTGLRPNQQISAAGFILNLYFPRHKK
jgi:hypothetical protein